MAERRRGGAGSEQRCVRGGGSGELGSLLPEHRRRDAAGSQCAYFSLEELWDLSPGSAAVDLHVSDTAGYEGKWCSEAQICMLKVTNLAPKYRMI